LIESLSEEEEEEIKKLELEVNKLKKQAKV
jgi:hypothetical protein